MSEPIIPIDVVTRDAHAAAAAGRGVTSCPYPFGSDAAHYWQIEFNAKAKEQVEEATT